MIERPYRVTFLMTHPVQYLSPWFRWMHANSSSLRLTVLYAVQPTDTAQATGFGDERFAWSGDLLGGYESRILTPGRSDASIDAAAFSTVDVPDLEEALAETAPDAVVVPGWHAAFYRRAFAICRRRGWPAVYRGDTHLASGRRGLSHRIWRRASRRRLAAYSAYLAVGTRSREYLQAGGAAEPLVFQSPHAVDNDTFDHQARNTSRAQARAQFGLAPEQFTVLFAGKLQEKKRPLDAIRAVARIADAQLLIVGTGPLEASCRAEAAQLGVATRFAGFLNQDAIVQSYVAADCLVLPSDGRETWGLVVNEAMATGLPAVVSDEVGCQPDLVIEGRTGAVARCGDITSLADALERIRRPLLGGHRFDEACRHVAAQHSFAAATTGLDAACVRLGLQRSTRIANSLQKRQVLALCGHMVVAGGMERMTFEVLRTLRADAGVHVLVNRWASSRIVRLAEDAAVAWQTYRCEEPLIRRLSVVTAWRIVSDVVGGSSDVIRHAVQSRASHIVVPDFLIAVRHWPALVVLRLLGRRVVLRVGMAPADGVFYARLWRWMVNSAVDRVVCNSQFFRELVLQHGLPAHKVAVIRNTVATRRPHATAAASPMRVIFVGQLIPGKGIDLLLDAVSLLRAEGLPVTLDIVGELEGGESPAYRGHRGTLIDRAAAADLVDAVRFLGLRDDVPGLMVQAVVHCCPSRLDLREGMAGVVLEAKAAGIPSIVTRSGSLPELVVHRVDGWIADDTAASVASGLRYFLTNEEDRRVAGRAALASLARFDRPTFERAWRTEFGLDVVTPEPYGLAASEVHESR
ncbi:MAG TPA: glycosyltransferase family 4 protein [Vicinamibacterales bacterium]|nr:glycosyltransferase family 4 protein [Vicinamibacterales bacterium]